MKRSAVPYDPQVSDAVLGFMRLIWAVDHELQKVSKRMEVTLGLTVPQRMTLLLIGRTPGILASELAQLLLLHPGTISGIVRRLEAAGLVIRVGDAADGRRRRLELSAEGRRANGQRVGTFESAVRGVLAVSTSSDLAAAARVLTQLANELHITEAASLPADRHGRERRTPAVPAPRRRRQ